MCLILYTQREWTSLDSIDKPFLPGKFKRKGKGCVSGDGFQLAKSSLEYSTTKQSSLKKQKAAIISNAFVNDILKHVSKFLNAAFRVTHMYIFTRGSAWNYCSLTDITHIQKETPGFLSNPISQLLSTEGEAEDDKHCLQYRLSFKLWVF